MVVNKYVKDDTGSLAIDNKAKKVAWKQHSDRLLNEEFTWNFEGLTVDPVVGPHVPLTIEMVAKAAIGMKNGKAAGPSTRVAEMLKASSDTGLRLVTDLANDMERNGTIPSDWENSFIIDIYNEKGDALIRDNYRGLKLLDHVMKEIERVMEKIIRERVFIDDIQFGFMPGRGKTDTKFVFRQLQENIWLGTGNCTLPLLTLKRHSIEYQEKLVLRKVIW